MQKLTIVALMFLAGCAYNVPSYQVQEKNVDMVKGGKKTIQVVQEKPRFDDTGSILCRAAGPVALPDGQTFAGYLASALKDELRSANVLAENAPTQLRVSVKRVDFSSSLGASNWYIDADYSLDGQNFSVSTVYHDRSSYLGSKACNNMAQYFRNAVAEHLRQLYAKPEFKEAIGFTEKSKHLASDQERFQKLKQLYENGVITEEEYAQKRKALLEEL